MRCVPPSCQVLTGIVDQLKPDDSLGVVLFSDGACAPRALSSLRGADVAELKRRVGGALRVAGWWAGCLRPRPGPRHGCTAGGQRAEGGRRVHGQRA